MTGVESLAATACWTAAVRASESKRSDRLFDDPWAEALAGETGADWMAHRTPGSVVPIAIRTRYFDDFLIRVVADDIRQVVIVASGLDTRAFRLAWPPATVVFELDVPSVFQYKEPILASAGARALCDRRLVGVDLGDRWEEILVQGGFEPAARSAWLLEGFLFYVSNALITRILDKITRLSAPASRIGFDIINAAVLTFPPIHDWIEMQAAAGAPWIGTMEQPEAFLAERGWRAELTQAGQPDANWGRWAFPILPVRAPDMPHSWYVTAEKL